MGGTGNEQETGGKAPSSNVHASTLKHLQLFRRDLLPLPFLSGLNPPKRGAPGVPGVTGVDGADATSSDSITTLTPIMYVNQKAKTKREASSHSCPSAVMGNWTFIYSI